jgi:transposase
MTDTDLSLMLSRLDRIEAAIQSLVEQKTVKDWYSVEEVAARLGKAEFTVREWCRLGRIHAQKRAYSRGPHAEWMIGHAELLRIQCEGLLPGS